jgi:multisubunit Na+/H+ antiporter MnhB subunit
MEHTVMMLIAIVLITLGYGHAKKGNFKGVFWYYLIGLIVMLAAVPWPFREALGGSWM